MSVREGKGRDSNDKSRARLCFLFSCSGAFLHPPPPSKKKKKRSCAVLAGVSHAAKPLSCSGAALGRCSSARPAAQRPKSPRRAAANGAATEPLARELWHISEPCAARCTRGAAAEPCPRSAGGAEAQTHFQEFARFRGASSSTRPTPRTSWISKDPPYRAA